MNYVYKITINNKDYIGYTSLTIEKRFHKHCLNADAGIKTKLYNSLRKYGVNEAKIFELGSYDDVEMAKLMEIKFINELNTFKNGLNMTLGGEGGGITSKLPPDKYEEYIKKRSNATSGSNNPNYSGYSDEELLNVGVELVKEKGYFSIGDWLNKSKVIPIPKSFSKNRFKGSFNNFKEELSLIMGFDVTYTKNKIHRENLAKKNRRYSNKELILFGVKLVEKDGFFSKIGWNEFHSLYQVPKGFSKNQFCGSFLKFKEEIAKYLGVPLDTIKNKKK